MSEEKSKTKKVVKSFVDSNEATPEVANAPVPEVPTGKEVVPAVIPKLGELLQAVVANQEVIIKQNETIVMELQKISNKPTTSYQYKPRYPQGGYSHGGQGYQQRNNYQRPYNQNYNQSQNQPQGQPAAVSTRPVSQVAATAQPSSGLNTKKLQLEQALAPFGDGVVIGETNMAYEVKVTRRDKDLWKAVAQAIGNRSQFMGEWMPAGANSCFSIAKP